MCVQIHTYTYIYIYIYIYIHICVYVYIYIYIERERERERERESPTVRQISPRSRVILFRKVLRNGPKPYAKLRCNLIQTSICNEYSGSTKITAHLDLTGHRKATPGTNLSNR